MQVSTVKCDICGKLKGETNGWFYAGNDRADNFWIETAHGGGGSGVIDICSESCATKALSQWMAGQGK